MENKTDAELVALAQLGNKEAFGQLMERYQQMAALLSRRLISNPEVARELVQEAFLQAYLSLDRLKEPSLFKSWLYGIVLNLCRSFLRRPEPASFSLEALLGGIVFDALPFHDPDPGLQERAEAQELHSLVLDSVQSLSSKNRAATLLFYYEQMEYREIAAILGISVQAVKGRLHKSRLELRERLLEAYPEFEGYIPVERKKRMLKVTLADVVKVADDTPFGGHVVAVLMEESGARILPIWVGPWEGEAMAIEVRGLFVPRPLTYNFMAKLLEAAGAVLEEVRVETLKDDTFYAVVKLRCGDRVQEVDARPSDAITLAIRMNCSILVSEDVMERASLIVPQSWGELGKGSQRIVQELEDKLKQRKQKLESQTEEEREKSRRNFLSYLYSSGS